MPTGRRKRLPGDYRIPIKSYRSVLYVKDLRLILVMRMPVFQTFQHREWACLPLSDHFGIWQL